MITSYEPYQILSDCPHCRVESAVVELIDPLHPAAHLGVATAVRCRMCAWEVVAADEPFAARHALNAGRCPACAKRLSPASRAGEAPCEHCGYQPRRVERRGPLALIDADEALARLRIWSAEEGEADVELFCVANLGGPSRDVIARLAAREVVHTSFDVIAYLFPSMQSGGGSASVEAMPLVITPPDDFDLPPITEEAPAPTRAPAPSLARAPKAPSESASPEPVDVAASLDPRLPARLLISVMVADGDLRAGERRFIEQFLAHEGLPPLQASDLRVWRPHELTPPADRETRERLIEACVHLMHLDSQRDGSEWRVVTAFSRAWGIDDKQLQAWDKAYDRKYAGAMTMLWRTLNRMVRVR